MLFDEASIGIAELSEIVAAPKEFLVLISIPDCAPCATMKSALSKAARLTTMPKLHHLVFNNAEFLDDRVAASLGRSITMFPSLLWRTRHGHRHWIRGVADKSGPFDARRLAVWLETHRD